MAQWDNLASYIDDINDVAARAARQSIAPVVRWSDRVFNTAENAYGPNTQEVLQFEDFVRHASPEALAIVGRTPTSNIRLNRREASKLYAPRLDTAHDLFSPTSVSRQLQLKDAMNQAARERSVLLEDGTLLNGYDELRAGGLIRDAIRSRLYYDGELPLILGDSENYIDDAAMSAKYAGRAIAGRGRIPMGEQDYGYFTNPWLTGLLSDQAAVSRGKDFRSGLLSLSELGLSSNPMRVNEGMLSPATVIQYSEKVPELNPDTVASAANWLAANSIPVTPETVKMRIMLRGGMQDEVKVYTDALAGKTRRLNEQKNYVEEKAKLSGMEGLLSPQEIRGLDYLSPEERGAFIMKALEERAQGLR